MSVPAEFSLYSECNYFLPSDILYPEETLEEKMIKLEIKVEEQSDELQTLRNRVKFLENQAFHTTAEIRVINDKLEGYLQLANSNQNQAPLPNFFPQNGGYNQFQPNYRPQTPPPAGYGQHPFERMPRVMSSPKGFYPSLNKNK